MRGGIASGDGESGSLQLFKFSFPTKESAEKTLIIQIECNLNMPYSELKDRTPYEDVVLNKSATNFFNAFPVVKNAPVFKDYQRILSLTEKEFAYKSVYSKTGGVLNIFNPKIRESMDSDLKTLFSRCEEEKEAIRLWKYRPSELWSDLPPKLVWAGGGNIERELFLDFSQYLTRMVRRKEFDTRGDALITPIRNLREWQLQPNKICSGMAPIAAIIKEREEIYERKSAFLKENHIECDFV
ncbi:hypothetical protein C5S53_06960 [Methanophagales archaeon]|nr:hypothetical protein C5S53_06960 [Methanophagales archaeon]